MQPEAASAAPRWPLVDRTGWCLALVFALYGYQGLVAGFALTALPNHFASLGASTGQVGAHIAIVGLPWILQPLWGPVVDRFGGFRMGRRRFWVVLALAASLLALARLLLAGPVTAGGIAAISAVFLLHSALAALVDTAIDGMIIDHVPTARLGRANAVTRAGFVSGIAVGTALFAWLLPARGLAFASGVLLAVGALVLVLPLLVREAPGDDWLSLRQREMRTGGDSFAAVMRQLRDILRRRSTLALLAFCFCVDFAGAVFRVPLAVELIQRRGWEAEALSSWQAGIALMAGTVGALLVGWWTDRVGPGRPGPGLAVAVLLALCALGHAVAGALLALGDPRWAARAGPLALGLSGVLPALLFVALAPAVMRASRGAAAATRFAMFMAALNLGDVAGSAMAGTVAQWLDLWATGLLAAAVFCLGAVLATLAPGIREADAAGGGGLGVTETEACGEASGEVKPGAPGARRAG
ncbi:MFS transporter [Falsiroseomonas sp. HC035]|uniref:MFS transporter n=1 Tax=Falsiroseomonas sp. HC035 TaxID=3390999 RepID=UPI003D3135C3